MQRSGKPYRVITIQFGMNLFGVHFFQKERFYKIRKLLQDSCQGIQFTGNTFDEVLKRMIGLTEDKGFASIIEFLQLLDLLSESTDTRFLSSEGFTPRVVKSESNRIQMAHSYILVHYTDPEMQIGDVAAQVSMSPSAFSHFFKKYTNKSFSQFLIDVRVGHACKLLLDTDETVNQITYRSGFNNMANFNRLFLKYRSCTPTEYRRRHKEKNMFDWTKQITPMQFLPPNSNGKEAFRPEQYATKLIHL
jgi:AraC-like DNA-binding protein